MENKKHSEKLIFRRVIYTIIISVIIPLALGFIKSDGLALFSLGEQFIIGAVVFLISTAVSMSLDTNRLLQRADSHFELHKMQNEADLHVNNIRRYIGTISKYSDRDKNFYFLYYISVLQSIEDALKRAVKSGVIDTSENMFKTTDLLMDVTERKSFVELSFVHRLDSKPNDFDDSPWARHYYERLFGLAQGKKVSIRRLFIFADEADLKDPVVQKILQLHHTFKVGYKVLPCKDWMKFLEGSGVRERHNEFGIWGDLGFFSKKTDATNVEGQYVNDPNTVGRMKQAYDLAWAQANIPKIEGRQRTISVDDLFNSLGS